MTFYSTTGTAATTAAETAKTAAETAKTAAEAAQAAVELLHDDFDDRYLGSKASDPAVDNDGNALAAGTLYFNSATTKMRVYSGSAWADITAVQGALITGNNLSDLTDDGAARTNLGLGTAATQNSSAFATAAQADQTVALTGGTGITTSGTYPNFTIANSSPDQTVALTGAGATTISGTYPNFTITSTNTTYSVGDGGLTEINFTSALNTKLAGIEASADVTDTTNVVAALTAGSNITIASDGTIAAPVAGITYANSWVDSGDNALLRLTPSSGTAQDLTLAAGSNVTLTPSGTTLTIASTDTTYSVTDGQLSQNNFTNTLKSKLDNIEVQADVTDASNVSSAGAVMKTLYSAGSFLYSTSSNNPESKSASQVRTILNISDGANNYVHPSHDGDDIDIDTGGLSGATVISDLDVNVTTDTLGHVVDANASVATRNLTLANLGYTGETDATADQTASEIRALVDSASDSNIFTDADHTKLDSIEASATADQTDEEIQDIVGAMVSGNTENGIAVTYDDTNGKLNYAVASQTDENFTTADHSKLDGIEAGATADQTDEEIQDVVGGMVTGNTENGIAVTYDDTNGKLNYSVVSQTDENFTTADHAKLDGIETGATADQTDEEIQDIVGGMVSGNTESGISVTYDDTNGKINYSVASQTDENFTTADHAKLDGIANNATANSTDATLKARAQHTGTQAISTVSGLQSALDAKQASLTFGIANTNTVQINSSSVADNDYAKFTSTGVEGRSPAEVRADLNVADGANAYVHPSFNHIPSGGSTNQILRYSSAGTAAWSDETTNIVYSGAFAKSSDNSFFTNANSTRVLSHLMWDSSASQFMYKAGYIYPIVAYEFSNSNGNTATSTAFSTTKAARYYTNVTSFQYLTGGTSTNSALNMAIGNSLRVLFSGWGSKTHVYEFLAITTNDKVICTVRELGA